MEAPVFDDIADPSCTCLACVGTRRQEAMALRSGGSPARRARRTAATVVTAGFVAAGVAPAAARALDADKSVDDQGPRQPLADTLIDQAQLPPGASDHTVPEAAVWEGAYGSPQGEPGPLRLGSSGGKSITPVLVTAPSRLGLATVTRDQIIERARSWSDVVVPYSQSGYRGGYRTDCSGYVSMAWGLAQNAWTGNLADYATPISKSALKPGDILLFHNAANPVRGSHVVIFDRWTDSSRTSYVGYEQTQPGTKHRTIPYAYFNYSSSYKAYRYKNVVEGGGSSPGPTTPGATVFPGAQYFGPGKSNAYITQLGKALVAKGYGSYYREGPGPTWGAADQQATAAFQRAQGWTGADADGIPGRETWARLMAGFDGGTGGNPAPPPTSPGATAFPGAQYFGPGKSNAYITQLGKALVAKGYGSYYREGPGPTWGTADQRATAAFQRAQGWTGADADGIPGKDTWALLMR
ncbi:peptidoglycan-binding protein [Yinghuangia sp. YIM S09857]|uniref:peptidoglycan-binding protein n=1 Tax=Yinghuangia sp. YIM S09857 TaxID=3436929 RepID=UPI003F53D5D0